MSGFFGIPDGGINQVKLKTSMGSVNGAANYSYKYAIILGASDSGASKLLGKTYVPASYASNIVLGAHSASGSANNLLTLPGGEYGFFPQIRFSTPNMYAQQRYITASGEVFWIFLLKNITTGLFEAGYQAHDHPCFGNGGDPILVSHPFSDFNPTTHEIIVINPTKEKVKEMKAFTKPKRLGLPQKDILELFSPTYKRLSEKALQAGKKPEKIKDAVYKPDNIEMDYPNISITTGIVADENERPLWFTEKAKVIKLNIKKYQPNYVKIRGLK